MTESSSQGSRDRERLREADEVWAAAVGERQVQLRHLLAQVENVSDKALASKERGPAGRTASADSVSETRTISSLQSARVRVDALV